MAARAAYPAQGARNVGGVFGQDAALRIRVVPGGVTVTPSVDKVTTFLWRLKELQAFIENVYLPDVLTMAEVYRDYANLGAARCRAHFGSADGRSEAGRRH